MKSIWAVVLSLAMVSSGVAEEHSRLVANLAAGKKQTVVTYGTSLTAAGAWVGHLRKALDDQFPGQATVINSAQSGMWSTWGVDNLDKRVIEKKPDVVLIEFAMNDAFLKYTTSVDVARCNLTNMIGRILVSKPETEIILMTMNPPTKGHLERRPNIEAYYQMYREVAKERKLLLIDHEANWKPILEKDKALFEKYVPDGIHPGPEGCTQVITPMMLKSLGIKTESAGTAQAPPQKPNVVLILVDDLGYQDLGCYGHPSIRTPVLDRLAADGLRLTDFHSGATVCTPSRMALLTGAYPTRVGWTRGVVGYLMDSDDGLNPEALTIAEIFKSEGYATAISGKWHIGRMPQNRPHRQGFDSAYYLESSNNQTKKIHRGDEVVVDPFENCKLTQLFTEEAMRFIREQQKSPFFLYLPYTAPHFPVQPHPGWKGRSNYGDYGDVVEELDFRIGTILDLLKELKIDQQTIVVFTSDNGPNPREKSGCFPFRGEKWSALEGGTRVPCIITWPGVIPKGQVSGALFSAMDLLPSLCRACGIDWKAKSCGKPKIDGLDLWDAVLGKQSPYPRTELLYWQGKNPEPQAIRVGDEKLFFDRRYALEGDGAARMTPEQAGKLAPYRQALNKEGVNPPMLFNLREDVGETWDLSEAAPGTVKALEARAKAKMAEITADGILPLSTRLQ